MAYNFGRAITYELFILEGDDQEGYVSLNGVTDTPTIYVFDSKPTREQARNGTGLTPLQTIVFWSNVTKDSTTATGKQFTITAISDPDPTSSKNRYTYWLGINFPLIDSGQVQTIVRALPMQRADLHHEPVGVTKADLEEIFSTIDAIASTAEQESKIQVAVENVKQDLEADGFEWAQIWEPDDLNKIVAYRALSMIMVEKIADTGDKWETRYREYKKQSSDFLDGLKLKYIADQGGTEPQSKEQAVNIRSVRIVR